MFLLQVAFEAVCGGEGAGGRAGGEEGAGEMKRGGKGG